MVGDADGITGCDSSAERRDGGGVGRGKRAVRAGTGDNVSTE
jgi:hypothetical protein